MDDLSTLFKSVSLHSSKAPSQKKLISILPPYIEHIIDYTTTATKELRTFHVKNNSPNAMRILGTLGMFHCRQISVSVKAEKTTKISNNFSFDLASGASLEFVVCFNPKFPGSDRQVVAFRDDELHSNSITLKMDCRITQAMASLVPASESPSNSDLSYYIPPSDSLTPQRERGPMIKKLSSPKYCGLVEDSRFIEMAMSGNLESVLDMFRSGLTPSFYKEQMEVALRLDHAVGQIEISAHDKECLDIEFEGDFLVVRFPGIIDEDYIIGPGANSIYLQYFCGDQLVYTCMCEYGSVNRNSGEVQLRPALNPSLVAGLTRVALRIKQSIIPLIFSLYGIERLSGDTINNVLFPLSLREGLHADCQAVNIRGEPSITFFNQRLNERQKAAVCNILEGRYGRVPFIIFGPPGTGKSTTVIEAILQTYTLIPNSVILATAQTNKSVDNLALKLIQTGVIPKHEIIRFVSQIREQEITNSELRACCVDVIPRSRLASLRIICTTFVKSAVFATADKSGTFFTHVFVDEASQCTEASVVISVNLLKPNGRLILAGDPYQLGPMTKLTNELVSSVISNSLLHRLIENRLYSKVKHRFENFGGYNPVLIVKLVVNYRNFQSLVNLFSRIFYDNELVAKVSSRDNDLCHHFTFLPNKGFPLLFHGVDGQDYLPQNSTSFVNVYEAVLVLIYIRQIIDHGISADKIAVISFYKKQAMFIKRLLASREGEDIECQTIEKFQGSEKTVVILTTVRTNKHNFNASDQRYSLKFLFNAKRFNVAISRAISMLIVIGDPNVMKEDSSWTELLNYCLKNKSYVGCGID